MTITGFTAQADIVGRRVQVAWEFVPAAGETLADIPRLSLRRKERDFAFPASVPSPDPYLVYDSNQFPPAPAPGSLTVTDLDGWEKTVNAERHVFEPISVAIATAGRFVEVLRRTTVTVYDSSGTPIRQRVEIVDVGGAPGALQANEVYYYQLFGNDLPPHGDAAAPYRSSTMVTDSYGQNRTLYFSLPEVYRRHDVVTRPAAPGSDSVPELSASFGQLRRFLDPFGIAGDSLRGGAEGLRTLHDVDQVEAKYLSCLAQWIGWDLGVDVEIPLRRNEIKTASRLYRLVGTLPGLRTLVTQSTGWVTQVSEFAQNIARSNQPPRRNLFAITPGADGKTWRGTDDAAELLGFGALNNQAVGGPGGATLVGTIGEPFALRPGTSLTIGVDGLPPATMQFGSADFADVAKATAAEVAAVLNRTFPEARCQAQGGKLSISSLTSGGMSQLQISPAATSLVSLENAPAGRLSTATDSVQRLRLFYEAWETPTEPQPGLGAISGAAAATSPSAAATGGYVLRRIHYKTFVDGQWRNSQPVFADRVTAQADPAVVILPGDRVWVAWIDDPMTSRSSLHYGLGTSRPAFPARLVGQEREPFLLKDGTVLSLAGNWSGLDVYTVRQADFADVAKATATELAAAMNAQLTRADAAREPNGAISLTTKTGGDEARLTIDLSKSTTARALGFDNRTFAGTPGSWSDEIDWSPPRSLVSVPTSWHAEVVAVNDPAGGVRVAWAMYRAGLWRIASVHWSEAILVATSNGLFRQNGAGDWASLAGLPSNDVRSIALDSNGTAWIATGAGVVLRRPDGTISALAPALPSPDVRDLVLAPDGTAWFATAGGLSALDPSGAVTRWTTGSGLPSNDVKALALGGDETLWIATALGAVRRGADGSLQTFGASKGMPADLVRGAAVNALGTAYLATASGLAIFSASGGLTTIDAAGGLASSDTRAVAVAADGTLWVATSAGVSRRSTAGAWATIDTSHGLASNDTRGLSLAPDGSTWVGTAAGACIIAGDGTVKRVDLVGGGAANPAVSDVHLGASSVQDLAVGEGGNREPCLTVDADDRIWLIWSRRLASGLTGESWGLLYRIYDPGTLSWGPETTLTSPPAGGRAADRTPSALSQAAGLQVYFASDRGGGTGLYSVSVSLAGAVAALEALPTDASSDLSPAPVTIDGGTWILYRGDANVALAQANPLPKTGISVRVPENGTLRRYAGTVGADLGDLNRLRTRLVFGDMQCYTPNRPDGAALVDSELYTRGTVGLYVSRANQGSDLTQQEVDRLRELIQRFIPINLRVVVVVVEQGEEEFVYPPGSGVQDSYSDDFPFLSIMGPVSDSSAAAMPGVTVLQSNKVDDVSANPASPATLSRRTFFPPLQ